MKIIDAHAHFINQEIIRGRVKNDEQFVKNFQNPSIEEGKEMWLKAMDKNNVEKVVFIALSSGNEDFLSFCESSERFVATTTVNPVEENAVDKLDKDIKRGCKGLKIFATTEGVDIADERAFKVYDYCEENNIPITFHFGVSIGRSANLNFGNPLKLSSIVSKYPNLKCIVAHFGAGFLKEALLVMYKNDNVYFDTSGTNNWLEYSPFDWTLEDLFRISLKAVGSKRILFGTDSHRMSEGYRENILKEQMEIVKRLVGEEGVEDIFYGNAKRVFGI
jgi:uncharacterized protein